MKHNTWNLRAMQVALAATGALVLCAPVLAQDDEVVVETNRWSGMAHRFGSPDNVVSITRRVSYADLDLASRAGALEFEARINDTARSICDKLNQMYRPSEFDRLSCVRNAVRDGMTKARVAIEAKRRVRTAEATARN